jgi:hypothetical protein
MRRIAKLNVLKNCVSNFYLLSWGVTGQRPVEGGSGKAEGFGARGETSPFKKDLKKTNRKYIIEIKKT